jgi:hypothetical protein
VQSAKVLIIDSWSIFGSSTTFSPGECLMPRYRITITSKDRAMMQDLVRKHQVQVFDHGVRHTEAHGYSVDAIAEPADIERLRNLGYHLQQHEDVDERGQERQREVGRGDRYKIPRSR